HAPGVEVIGGPPGRILLRAATPEALRRGAEAATQVFGIYWATETAVLDIESLDDLVAQVTPRVIERVRGRRFAVRVRRRGHHDWKSLDAERALGAALLDASAGVNLTQPDVTV